MDRWRVLELLVDLRRARRSFAVAAHQRIRSPRISDSRCGSIVRPTIFAGSISNSSAGGSIPLHDRHVRRLVAEVAEVDRERRLRRARDADEHDVGFAQPRPDAVVELDRELDRRHAPEVGVVQRRPRTRLHLRRLSRHLRDRLDRMAEQVAVVELRPPAERAHRLAELRLDERVDDDRRTALHPVDGELEVGDRLDARVPDLEELLLRELRLERLHESLGGLAGRIGDHVQLDRGHAQSLVRRLETWASRTGTTSTSAGTPTARWTPCGRRSARRPARSGSG